MYSFELNVISESITQNQFNKFQDVAIDILSTYLYKCFTGIYVMSDVLEWFYDFILRSISNLNWYF